MKGCPSSKTVAGTRTATTAATAATAAAADAAAANGTGGAPTLTLILASFLQAEDPTLLLFLRQLRAITLESRGEVRRYQLREADAGCVTISITKSQPNQTGAESSEEHPYFVAKSGEGLSQVTVVFPLAGAAPMAAALSSTLPLSNLVGLRTPLNACFDLTANREALMEGSERNAQLRDDLAELWLKTVAQSAPGAVAEHSRLSVRAWLLQPGPELAQTSFWAPFVNRVRSGLREVPLIPVVDTDTAKNRLLPISRCRKPDSPLLATLGLTPNDLSLLDLGIPVDAYVNQLPLGADIGMSEFNTRDLLQLLSLPATSTDEHPQPRSRFESRGPAWRKVLVKALAKRGPELDLLSLRQTPLFILADARTSPSQLSHATGPEAPGLCLSIAFELSQVCVF